VDEGHDLRERLQYLGLGEDDRAALEELRPAFEKHADSVVASFYRHLLAFEPTRGLLTHPDVRDRLIAVQRSYLLSLAPPSLDEDYVEQRLRVGETHNRVRLEPRWYLGAYAVYLNLLIPVVLEHHEGRPQAAERAIRALVKVLMLDAQLAMESYIGRREADLEYLTEELAASSRDLERTSENQRHELREIQQRARDAEQLASIGTLVAGLAHEIGTPMGVIQGHADLLERSVTDERGRWRLRTIREQIARISGIIQTLLDLARPRPPQLGRVDLAELIQSSLEFVSERLGRRSIEVETDFPFRAWLRADRQKLQQVLLNLFLNAVDAMPRGGRLRVALERDGDRGVVVRVRDSGIGIAREALARVFEPFFTTKPAGSGSGLGLMVARGIVEEHGGTIEVASEEGDGAEFLVRLPADSLELRG
jgi:signal transduction histidine kinase